MVWCHYLVSSDCTASKALAPYILSSSEVDDYFLLIRLSLKEFANDTVDCFHSQPVATINSGRSPLRLFHKVPIEVRFWQVQSLNTSLGYNATAVCLHSRDWPEFSGKCLILTPMIRLAFFSEGNSSSLASMEPESEGVGDMMLGRSGAMLLQ
jgi:hypothetical protein